MLSNTRDTLTEYQIQETHSRNIQASYFGIIYLVLIRLSTNMFVLSSYCKFILSNTGVKV